MLPDPFLPGSRGVGGGRPAASAAADGSFAALSGLLCTWGQLLTPDSVSHPTSREALFHSCSLPALLEAEPRRFERTQGDRREPAQLHHILTSIFSAPRDPAPGSAPHHTARCLPEVSAVPPSPLPAGRRRLGAGVTPWLSAAALAALGNRSCRGSQSRTLSLEAAQLPTTLTPGH